MTPDLYFDTYKQYKAGTNKLVTWLAETAKACGASGLDPTSESSMTKLTLPVKEFVRLAKIIVNSAKPKINIPASIIGVLDEVIAARKRCATWFRDQPDVPTSDAPKDGHQYFIDILEQVLEILTPASGQVRQAKRATGERREAAQSGDSTANGHVKETLSNMFECLTVQEPSPLSLTDERAPPDTKTKSKGKIPQTVYEIKTSEDDLMFAIFCFFIDCIDIRKFLRVVWLQWRFGQCSLTTAALVTNIAFDVIRHMNKGFAEAFPQFTTHEEIDSFLSRYLLNHSYRRSHNSSDGTPKVDSKNNQLLNEHGKEALSGQTVYRGIRQFFDPKEIGRSSGFQMRFLNPDLSKIPNREPEYKLGLLARSVSDCLLLTPTFGATVVVADEFTRGLGTLNEGDPIPPWLVIAGEIFVDLHYSLRDEIRRGFEETQATADRALETLRDHFRHYRSMTLDRSGHEWTEKYLIQLPAFVQKVIRTDHVTSLRKMDIHQAELDLPEFYIFKHHPVLCGLITFHMDRVLHYGGVTVANEWQVILATAHLYNVVRQCGYLDVPWVDMETVISMQTVRQFFVGNRPTSFVECFNRFWLAFGVSAAAFAPNVRSRNDPKFLPSMKWRKLETRTPILDICREYHQANDNVLRGLTLHDIETVLSTSVGTSSDKGTTEIRRDLSVQWKRSHRLSPIQLLKALKEGIDEEESRLHFNYISLNKRCLELLKQLRTTLQGQFDYMWPDWTEGDTNIVNVVHMVFHVVSNTGGRAPRVGGVVGPAPDMAKNYSPFLGVSASLIRGVIEKDGDVETKNARALCGKRKDERDMDEVLRAEGLHDVLRVHHGHGVSIFCFQWWPLDSGNQYTMMSLAMD